MWKFFLLAICLGLSIACSKSDGKNYSIVEENGIKVYKNLDKPSVESLEISPGEVFRIEGISEKFSDKSREFYWPRYLDIDSKKNIFILDITSTSVKKFDKNGNFIKSFGKKGQGPGEIHNPYLLAVLNDIVFVPSPYTRMMVKFDNDGNFIGNTRIEGIPNFMQSVGADKFIGFLNYAAKTAEGTRFYFSLMLMDMELKKIAVLREYEQKSSEYNDLLDRYTAYAFSSDKIFVAKNSINEYKINVFDFTGKLLYRIEKEYQKILFNKEELQELNDGFQRLYKKFGASAGFVPVKATYKKAITSMYWDKEGRLLVVPAVKRDKNNRYDYLVDVFKDGIFLKRIKLDKFKGYDFLRIHEEKIFFKGDRIYQINEPDAVITVYEY